jgi:hypothetical protein
MINSPSAIGSEIPSICTFCSAMLRLGTQRPSNRPAAIATPIQTGNIRSSADSFVTTLVSVMGGSGR